MAARDSEKYVGLFPPESLAAAPYTITQKANGSNLYFSDSWHDIIAVLLYRLRVWLFA
jgi:hypothetical protein